MSSPTLRRLLPALALSLTVGVAAPAPASAAEPVAAQRAAGWLAGALTDAGTVVASFPGGDGPDVTSTDYGRTVDAGLALLVAGGHDDVLGRTLTSVATPTAVMAYTQGVPFDQDGAAYAGATAKLAFFIEATGGDATQVGGVDLLAQLQSLVTQQGRLADRSRFGDYANVFGHAFALLALDTAGRAPAESLVQGLLGAQCADGSFPEAYEPKAGAGCTGSVDATGLVLQALAALDLGTSEDAAQARTWLQGRQQSDGGFPGEAPVNSTGYAAIGLAAVGADAAGTDRAATYLAGQQNTDGGLRRGAGSTTTSDVFATAQALPGLLGRHFRSAVRSVVPQPIPCESAAVTLAATTITATGGSVATLAAASGTEVDLFAYSRPGTDFTRVRSGTVGHDGTVAFVLKPATNTRLYAQQRGCTAGSQVVLNVRTLLTLAVARSGTRDYTFSGRALPARTGGLVVSLYRVTDGGQQVLTAQTRADARSGAYSIRRAFSGGGRFGFVVRTGQDLQNAPGASNVRSLLVF